MTQRQRRYWRAYYKVSNYKAVLDAVKGPEFTIDVSEFRPNYVEGIAMYLENKAHEMYLALKSLGAIKAANGIKDSAKLQDMDLENLIALATREILDARGLPDETEDVVERGDDDD
jgi:hypothetical protein